MVSLQKMPDEVASFIAQHNLMRADILATEQPASLQQATTLVATVAMRGFAELAGQASNRETLWNAAREAATAGPGAASISATGGNLLKMVLDDRYHGTVSTTAAQAGVSAATIGYLLDLVPAATRPAAGPSGCGRGSTRPCRQLPWRCPSRGPRWCPARRLRLHGFRSPPMCCWWW